MIAAPPSTNTSVALRIQLLGEFKVWAHGQLVPGRSWRRKPASLVKVLALAPGHRLHRDEVIEALWPELGDPAAATNVLHRTLHDARAVLEPGRRPGQPASFLTLRAEIVALTAEQTVGVDVTTFERAASAATGSGQPADYAAALALYTGDLLPDDAYQDWAIRQRERLRSLAQGLWLDLARGQEERGELLAAQAALERLLAAEPLHEAAHADLMRLYMASGQPARALRQYQRLTDILRRELEAEPEPRLQAFYRQILDGQPVINRSVPAQTVAPPTNLPAAVSPLIGRRAELSAVGQLLRQHRLVTLTGSGGSGKTRLALEVATGRRDEGGVWLVELGGLTDPRLVPHAVAGALGLIEAAGQELIALLIQRLQAAPTLLVLDNCEHLIEAASELGGQLLRACPPLRVLATSREPLRLAGEVVWPVPPLSLPTNEADDAPDQLNASDALRLFVERARAARPDFALTADNAASAVAICRRLDGLPLAIELAAARVRLMPLAQIAARLDDALSLLTSGSRSALPHQRTMRATCAWSYGLLSPAEQALARRLAVFAGGWSLEAAEAVGGERWGELAALVDRSLVIVEETSDGTRYRVVEALRQFLTERLIEHGEQAAVQADHVRWALALAEAAEGALTGPHQGQWMARLEREHDNLRAALGYALRAGQCELGLRLAGALWRFWEVRGYLVEGQRWLEELLALPATVAPAVRAKALNGAGNLARDRADFPRAIERHQAALALRRTLGDRRAVANSLNNLGATAGDRGQLAEARALHEEALSVRRAVDDRWGIALSLNNLGIIVRAQGDYPAAIALLEEALAIEEQLNNTAHRAAVLNNLGRAVAESGGRERAAALQQAALRLQRAIGNRAGQAWSLANLADLALDSGDLAQAETLQRQALSLRHEIGSRLGQALSQVRLGFISARRGDWAVALDQYLIALRHDCDLGNALGQIDALEGVAVLAAERGHQRRADQWWRAATAARRSLGAPRPPSQQRLFGEVALRLQAAVDADQDCAPIDSLTSAVAAVLTAGAAGHLHQPVIAPVVVGPAPRCAVPAASPLSPRELAVLGLVERGLSNRAIACELAIAERTVTTHMTNILAKLGLPSRSAAAAWLRQQGPPGRAEPQAMP